MIMICVNFGEKNFTGSFLFLAAPQGMWEFTGSYTGSPLPEPRGSPPQIAFKTSNQEATDIRRKTTFKTC